MAVWVARLHSIFLFTAEQLKREQDSILVYFEPYYLIDNQVMENAISRFDTDVNTKPNLKNLEPAYIRYIRNKLKEVYTQGIMSVEDYERIASSATRSFRLKEGNVANSRNIESVYTIRSAYEKILNDRPKNLDENKLKSADIHNYLKENIIYDASTSEKAKREFIQQVSPTIGG